ncbi:uncharacterized protein METZ01_LOCUS139074, partial [marine metagenome]
VTDAKVLPQPNLLRPSENLLAGPVVF